MKRLCLLALISHWRKKPLQLLGVMMGLTVATAFWTSIQAINSEARASYDTAASLLSEGQYDHIVSKLSGSITQDTYIQLRRAGWLVSPILEGQLNGIRLIGFDYLTAPDTLQQLVKSAQKDGYKTAEFGLLIANTQTAKRLETEIKVVIKEALAPAIALGDIGTVQQILKRDDLSRLLVLPGQPMGQVPLNQVGSGLQLKNARQAADLSQLTESFHLNLSAFALLGFAVGLFIVYSTVGLAFEQRRGMIRMLRVQGVPLRLIIGNLILEVLFLTTISAILGIILGYVIASVLLPDVAATLRGLYGAKITSSLSLRSEWWLSGIGITLLGATVAFADRIWQTTKIPISANTRPALSAEVNRSTFRMLGYISLLLFSVMIIIAMMLKGLLGGFLLLACLLLGAAFGLPALAFLILSAIERKINSPMIRWFLADTRHQLPALNLPLMALLLAISANVGVSTMVSSFRLTFSAFLDQRLAPELYVEVSDKSQSLTLANYLERENIESLPLLSSIDFIEGEMVRINGISVGPTYRKNWIFLDYSKDPWDQVQSGSAVIINEQLARRTDLQVGDSFRFDDTHILPIVAIVGDYGNPNGQVIGSASLIKKIKPNLYAAQFGIRTQNVKKLKQDLSKSLALQPHQMIDQESLKTMSMDIFERTFAITDALNVLTLGVAGISLLISLFILADLRIPQLAPVWAIGLNWRSLSLVELARALTLTVLVYFCSIPLGLSLAWILLNIVNVEAFGWQLPMYLFPGAYFELGLYAMFATLIAAIWPALGLIRSEPSTLLKTFANER